MTFFVTLILAISFRHFISIFYKYLIFKNQCSGVGGGGGGDETWISYPLVGNLSVPAALRAQEPAVLGWNPYKYLWGPHPYLAKLAC